MNPSSSPSQGDSALTARAQVRAMWSDNPTDSDANGVQEAGSTAPLPRRSARLSALSKACAASAESDAQEESDLPETGESDCEGSQGSVWTNAPPLASAKSARSGRKDRYGVITSSTPSVGRNDFVVRSQPLSNTNHTISREPHARQTHSADTRGGLASTVRLRRLDSDYEACRLDLGLRHSRGWMMRSCAGRRSREDLYGEPTSLNDPQALQVAEIAREKRFAQYLNASMSGSHDGQVTSPTNDPRRFSHGQITAQPYVHSNQHEVGPISSREVAMCTDTRDAPTPGSERLLA